MEKYTPAMTLTEGKTRRGGVKPKPKNQRPDVKPIPQKPKNKSLTPMSIRSNVIRGWIEKYGLTGALLRVRERANCTLRHAFLRVRGLIECWKEKGNSI